MQNKLFFLILFVSLFYIGSDVRAYVNCKLPSDLGKECDAPSARYCGEDGFFIKQDRHYCVFGATPALVCNTVNVNVGNCTGLTEKQCSPNKSSVETVTFGCNPDTVDDTSVNACTKIVKTEITEKCYAWPNPKCLDNNILASYIDGVCVGTSPTAHCILPVEDPTKRVYCSDKNKGECSNPINGFNRSWLNTTYKCGDSLTSPYLPDCIINATTSDNCKVPQRICSPTDPKNFTITPGEKCVVSPSNTPNSASCVPDGTVPGDGRCVSAGICLLGNGGKYQVAGTANYNCNPNPSQINNCLLDVYIQNDCRKEIKECVVSDGKPASKVTPAQTCSVDDNTNPVDGGTHGQCHDSTILPETTVCVDGGFRCTSASGDANDPPLIGQQLKGFCDEANTKECKQQWQSLGAPFPCSNQEVPWPGGEKRCSDAGVEEKWGNIQCIGAGDGSAQPTCGVSNPHWKLVQSCSLLCTAWDTCDGTNVVKTKHCNGCKDLACTSWTEANGSLNCSPPSEDTASYCSKGVQCTLTAKYSGQCIDPLKNGSAGCESPTITVTCSGPCGGGGGGGGGGGPCSPAGSTQACSGGGSQTCGGDGIWGDCECTTGSSLPHSECDKDGKCSSVNSCGVSDCSNCGGCPAGQDNPHSVCDANKKCVDSNTCGVSDCSNCGGCPPGQNNPFTACIGGICTSLNACGSSDCSNCGGCPAGETNPHTACDPITKQCTSSDTCGVSNCENCGGCPPGETNPHTACINGKCSNSNTCGISNCDNCGGPVIAKCDTNPLSPMYKRCTTAGTGKICSQDAWCQTKYCDNSSKQCVFGGDSGTDCTTNSDCATPPLPRCNANSQTCIASGKGMLCTTNTDCRSTYCDYRSQKCIFGGNSKISCEGNPDCESPPTGPVSKCDVDPASPTYQQCSEGGKGILCNNDLDCEFQPTRCNGARQCVPDDCGGIQCNSGLDCQSPLIPTQCNACRQCVPGGGGADCSNNSDCEQQKFTCTGSRQCLPDDCGTVLCSDASQCESQPLQCNACQQCVPGGGGGDCSSDDECSFMPIECNSQKQCVPGGGGAPCPDDPNLWPTFCQDQAFKCNTERQCVPDDSGGDSCDPNNEGSDCQSQPLQCNAFKQCVPGGGGGDCSNDSDCHGEPPTASNLQVLRIQCIGILGTGGVSFQWDYSDPENNPESHFWLEVDDNSNFSSPEVSREVSNPGNPQNQQLVLAKLTPTADSINFNKPYYWRVKVQENVDGFFQDSGWVNGGQYTLAGHPDPVPSFISFPRPSAPGATVNFKNLSTCYNISGANVACNSYNWNFGDNSASSNAKDISHAYSTRGSYSATMTVYDDTGTGCLAGQTIPVTDAGANELPKWKEISPFGQ